MDLTLTAKTVYVVLSLHGSLGKSHTTLLEGIFSSKKRAALAVEKYEDKHPEADTTFRITEREIDKVFFDE